MRGRGLTSEAAINVNVPGAINPAINPAPARATEAIDAQQARPPTQQAPPNVQVVRRVPPVVTVHDLADLLADSSDVIARIMPSVASAADVVRNLEARRLDGTLGTVPSNDGTTASAQREMLRTSMTLHSAGSLLMELARLTSSVHVNGAASDPPQFMSNFARQHEQTMRREQQAQAAAGTTATNAAVVNTATAAQGFLAPPLMYLDPRGGTQPLSGLSMRPSIQQAGLHNMPGVQMPGRAGIPPNIPADLFANALRGAGLVPPQGGGGGGGEAGGRPMPSTMGDANAAVDNTTTTATTNTTAATTTTAAATTNNSILPLSLTNMIDQALGGMIGTMTDRMRTGVAAVADTNASLIQALTEHSGTNDQGQRLADMLQRHRDETAAARDREAAVGATDMPADMTSLQPARVQAILQQQEQLATRRSETVEVLRRHQDELIGFDPRLAAHPRVREIIQRQRDRMNAAGIAMNSTATVPPPSMDWPMPHPAITAALVNGGAAGPSPSAATAVHDRGFNPIRRGFLRRRPNPTPASADAAAPAAVPVVNPPQPQPHTTPQGQGQGQGQGQAAQGGHGPIHGLGALLGNIFRGRGQRQQGADAQAQAQA